MWVINDDEIAAAPCQSAARADGEVLSLGRGLPLTRRCGVCVDGHAGEHLLVDRIAQHVADLAAKVHGKVGGVGRLDDVLVGVMPEEVCGEEVGCKF